MGDIAWILASSVYLGILGQPFSLIFPHFFLKLKSRTTFQNFLNILKTIQLYHTTPSSSHDITNQFI